MASKLLLCLLLFLSLLPLFSSLPSESLLDGTEVLSNSGFLSMALTLGLLSGTLSTSSPSLTIFSPYDAAFAQSGQPTIPVLQYHFSSLYFSPQSLKSLARGSKILTLLPDHFLIVTSSPTDDHISINGVKINGSPIYDDGSLIIFGVDDFFDLEFRVPRPSDGPFAKPGCRAVTSSGGHSLGVASAVLRSRGYSIMASFLDLQLVGFMDKTELTLFAPIDDVIIGYVGNFSEYSSVFFGHVVPCRIIWNDLVNFNSGSTLATYKEGFKINITRSGDVMIINGAPVTSPELYHSDWLVVHGLGQESSSDVQSSSKKILSDYGEF